MGEAGSRSGLAAGDLVVPLAASVLPPISDGWMDGRIGGPGSVID